MEQHLIVSAIAIHICPLDIAMQENSHKIDLKLRRKNHQLQFELHGIKTDAINGSFSLSKLCVIYNICKSS